MLTVVLMLVMLAAWVVVMSVSLREELVSETPRQRMWREAEECLVAEWAANPDSEVADLERELGLLYHRVEVLSDHSAALRPPGSLAAKYTGTEHRSGGKGMTYLPTNVCVPEDEAVGGLEPVASLPKREPARAAGAAMAVDMPGGCVCIPAADPSNPRVDAILRDGVVVTGRPVPGASLANRAGAYNVYADAEAWVLVPHGAVAIYEHNVVRRFDLSDTVPLTQHQEV